MKVIDVETGKIHTGKYGLRDDVGSLTPKLRFSVVKVGLLHPLTVQERGDGDYDLVAGHIRLAASKELKHPTVPVVVVPAGDTEGHRRALAENFARVELKPLEKARALQLLEESGMDRKNIAMFLGLSPPQVTNLLAQFQLDPAVQEAINKGDLKFGHSKALLALKDEPVLQLEALRAIKQRTAEGKTASARYVEDLARQLKAKANGSIPAPDPKLPKGVTLQRRCSGNRLVIDFKNTEQLMAQLSELRQVNFEAG